MSQNHLNSLNVTHLKTRQVFQKTLSYIDPTPEEMGLSLCGNIKLKESTTITFTNLGQNLKVYDVTSYDS